MLAGAQDGPEAPRSRCGTARFGKRIRSTERERTRAGQTRAPARKQRPIRTYRSPKLCPDGSVERTVGTDDEQARGDRPRGPGPEPHRRDGGSAARRPRLSPLRQVPALPDHQLPEPTTASPHPHLRQGARNARPLVSRGRRAPRAHPHRRARQHLPEVALRRRGRAGRPAGGASAARGRRRHRRLCGADRSPSARSVRRSDATGRRGDQRLPRRCTPHRGELRRRGSPRGAEPGARGPPGERPRERERQSSSCPLSRRLLEPRQGRATCCCARSPRSSRRSPTCA